MSTTTYKTLKHAVSKTTAKFTQEINLHDGSWAECDFEDTALNKRVVDHTVRKAYKRPMAADWAWPTTNPRAASLYTQANIDPATVTIPDLAELLYYDAGCMFAKHEDRKRGDNHLGTILFVFNSDDLEGGELHLEQQDGKVVVVAADPGGCFMVFIPLHMSHWVSKVIRGYRLVAKCAVMGLPSREDAPPKTSRGQWRRRLPPGRKD